MNCFPVTIERKRSYMGFLNYDKDDAIEWWRKKAVKRYDKLKESGQLRKELELWNSSSNIDIIR